MPYPSYGVAPSRRRIYSRSARVRIELTRDDTQTPINGEVDRYVLVQYTDNGTIWYPVRGTVGGDGRGLTYNSAGKIVVWDYEAPPKLIRQYRGITVSVLANGDVLMSDPSPIGFAVLYLRSVWIKDVNNPTRNFTVPVDPKWLTVNDNQTKDVVLPAGATRPVIVSDANNYASFSTSFTAIGEDDWDKVKQLRDSGDTMLLQTPKAQWWVQVSDATERDEDMFSLQEDTARLFRVKFTEVDAI